MTNACPRALGRLLTGMCHKSKWLPWLRSTERERERDRERDTHTHGAQMLADVGEQLEKSHLLLWTQTSCTVLFGQKRPGKVNSFPPLMVYIR